MIFYVPRVHGRSDVDAMRKAVDRMWDALPAAYIGACAGISLMFVAALIFGKHGVWAIIPGCAVIVYCVRPWWRACREVERCIAVVNANTDKRKNAKE